ncbi:MAG TPA: hypothetical protein VMY36_03265 [Patescibacteria group bacterium]|nr:hypothetical protein [Patescibacteria group bacterium]
MECRGLGSVREELVLYIKGPVGGLFSYYAMVPPLMILSRQSEIFASCLSNGQSVFESAVAKPDVVQVDVGLEGIQDYQSQEAIMFLTPLADSHYIRVIPRSAHPTEPYLTDVRYWRKRETL